MHHLWARAHLTVLEIRLFGAVVVPFVVSILCDVFKFYAAKVILFREITRKSPSFLSVGLSKSKNAWFPIRIVVPLSITNVDKICL